jgi:hypothetical protein
MDWDAMKHFALLPALLLLAACGQESVAPANANTMTCVAGGLKLTGAGEPAVGIASLGIQGGTITGFGLSLSVEQAGKVHEVSTALMPLPMQTGTYHFPSLADPGMTLASYKIRKADRDLLRDYNGGTYSQQFSPVENDPDAKLKIQVDKIVVTDATQPGFKRVHAVGNFEFNAAALPGPSPSDACATSAITRSLLSAKAGKRLLPLFDSAVCGAEKAHVRCDFDATADLVAITKSP